jgi:hypothetical protein
MTTPDENATVIAAQTRRIDGVITLADIASRLRQGAADRDGRSVAARDPEVVRRLDRISELANQLADELEQLPPA